MRWLRRMFNVAYQKARAAEGQGQYRHAAALYVEANMPKEAVTALLFHAARSPDLEERLDAYHDALRWLPEDDPRRVEVGTQIGLAVVDDAQRRGARSLAEKRRLEDGAHRLEKADRHSQAATAWELLGRRDAVIRCLEAAGDVERLESLLEETGREDERERQLRGLLSDYEDSMKLGARRNALEALRQAAELVPHDSAVADLLVRLRGCVPSAHRVSLVVDGARWVLVGRTRVVLGRAGADVVVRGASVSRRHASLECADGTVKLRDLDSRNGTLVEGLPIDRAISLSASAEVGLGDDVRLRVTSLDSTVTLQIEHGLDQGTRVLVGLGPFRIDGLAATITFPGGHPALAVDAGATLTLDTQRVALPIELLVGDEVYVDQVCVEVKP